MRRSLLCLCLLVVPLAGCTLCPSPFDCDYGLYGGSWERHHPSEGRVGSAFNDAGAPVMPPREELSPPSGEPTPSGPSTPTPTPLRPDVEEGI